MRLFEKITGRVPRKMALAVMSIAGLWGMRTPPEPEVVAQMAPSRGTEGAAPEPGSGLDERVFVHRPRKP